MKKYLIIIATLALLMLVFAPAAFAQDEGGAGAAGGYGGGGYGGGYGDGGWGGYGGGGWGGYGGGWNNCQGNCYRVRYGDTLFSIGRRFNVNPWYIAQVNGLQNPNWIYAGQRLYIPSGQWNPYPWPARQWRPYPMPYPGGYPHPMPHDGGHYGGGYGYDGGYGYGYGDDGYGAPDQGYGDY